MREIASDPEQLGEFLGGLAGVLTLDVHVGRMSVARNADDALRSPSNRSVCSPNSFSADTSVLTPDGEKPISEIEIGDEVLAYNEATGEVGVYPVTAVLVNYDPAIVELTIDQEQLETTPEHPFYVEGTGWVDAGELKAGDQVRQADGTTGTVRRVEIVQREQVMYNLTVAGAHTFFVGEEGWLVHNTGCSSSLLPDEGDVGTYKELVDNGSTGDNITPHHMPADTYMRARGPAGYTRNEGISMNMEQPSPGTGGRHRRTQSYGSRADTSIDPRIALARDIRDARSIYMKDGLYGPMIRQALQEVISRNLLAWPGFFDKP